MTLSELSDDVLRVMVAEACGWTLTQSTGLIMWAGLIMWGWKNDALGIRFVPENRLPNYPADLNACAEFERTLTDDEHLVFRSKLLRVIHGSRPWVWRHNDSAAPIIRFRIPSPTLRCIPRHEKSRMKAHNFYNPSGDSCQFCGESYDHPIHELDGVAIGDAEDDDDPREDERRDDELTGTSSRQMTTNPTACASRRRSAISFTDTASTCHEIHR